MQKLSLVSPTRYLLCHLASIKTDAILFHPVIKGKSVQFP